MTMLEKFLALKALKGGSGSGGSGGGSSDGGGDSVPVIHALEVTENGVYEAPDGVDGYSPITVDVPIPEIVLQNKTIDANGTYTADSGFDGLGEVTVNVATSGGEEWIGDGNTHIWITLHEGRTSPMLGVCPNGTVTVDWGDGTTPDTLTGTSLTTVKYTPTHEYAAPGDYVITLTVEGEVALYAPSSTTASDPKHGPCILRFASGADERNVLYLNAINKVEIGDGVTLIDSYAFTLCNSLKSIAIRADATTIDSNAFNKCYSIESVTMDDGVTGVGNNAFGNCYILKSVTIPGSVKSIGTYAFSNCCAIESIAIPGMTRISGYAFSGCSDLKSVEIQGDVTYIDTCAFQKCYTLETVTFQGNVTTIAEQAFYDCWCVRCYDFTKCTAVPTLINPNALYRISPCCEIRVPAALYDEWIAATNWATYASQIVAV
jgi:hypothetical protein